MSFVKDPLGYAIWDYAENKEKENIIVKSDLCDDDIIPVHYLFRNLDEMPELEQVALSLVSGKTLDIGAGSGCHSAELIKMGIDVAACDISKGACDYMLSEGINASHLDFNRIENVKYDSLLLLMNGLGIAGKLSKMPAFLKKLKNLLSDKGRVICDSTDIKYMYQDDEGGVWMDLNSDYYGEMQFDMHYKNVSSGWFDWIYIDQQKLAACCKEVGLNCKIIFEAENNHYLAELTIVS